VFRQRDTDNRHIRQQLQVMRDAGSLQHLCRLAAARRQRVFAHGHHWRLP